MKNQKAFSPKNEWLLIRPKEQEKNFGTSFVASDDNRHQSNTGEVIAVGPGRHEKKLDAEVGEEVMFQSNGSVKVFVKEEELLLVHMNQLLGGWTTT